MSALREIRSSLRTAASAEKAVILSRFFKTGKGEYGEGDRFLGIVVPDVRRIVRHYAKNVTTDEISELLASPFHEERLCGFFLIVAQYEQAAKRGDTQERANLFDFYLSHKERANNWDLVDLSADKVVGAELLNRGGDISLLTRLARSPVVWNRRIAMLSTFAFIKKNSCDECFAIADLLIADQHDLIHKAVGWMLRETGKRVSTPHLETFLKTRYPTMPRTMLRYAIERFPEPRRKAYLVGRACLPPRWISPPFSWPPREMSF